MNKKTTALDALKEFTFCINKNEENEALLEELGYERRNGSCTYKHSFLEVAPLKNWYWPIESVLTRKLVEVEAEPAFVTYKIKS